MQIDAVARERADLDGAPGAHEARQHREERSLLDGHLHHAHGSERGRLVRQIAQHVVGRRAVGDQVLVHGLGEGEEFLVHGRDPSARD